MAGDARRGIDPALIKTLFDWLFKIGAVVLFVAKGFWAQDSMSGDIASFKQFQRDYQEERIKTRERLRANEVQIENLKHELETWKQLKEK